MFLLRVIPLFLFGIACFVGWLAFGYNHVHRLQCFRRLCRCHIPGTNTPAVSVETSVEILSPIIIRGAFPGEHSGGWLILVSPSRLPPQIPGRFWWLVLGSSFESTAVRVLAPCVTFHLLQRFCSSLCLRALQSPSVCPTAPS